MFNFVVDINFIPPTESPILCAPRSADSAGIRVGKQMGRRLIKWVSRYPEKSQGIKLKYLRSDNGRMTEFASMLAERGFTCLEVDLAPPKDRQSNADTLMHYFGTELSSHIRLCAIPFPPVIFARSFGSLIAQTYISSYPASGLLLISPPVSNEAVPSALLPSSLREFDFEPKFPCGILYAQGEMKRLEHNRLWRDPNVDRLMVKDTGAIDGREGQAKIEQWLDEIGV
ncbi:hypothetical protein SCP_0510350 [Sparassis crispa]|uniref:Uncharacterized protein n=1 Tax=Sparassis crispa TaxID=139825 RepID=A0A401GP37_9APHY|nr:hypothetical protein SCP_0510350 [Sparassis crispa]GBE83976.1 hypothetical protein SCP_0510350 [Sparassis crispa]